MPYSQFTLEQIEQIFGLSEEKINLFDNIKPIAPTQWLKDTLQKAKIMPTKSEKSRSELLITPILLEIAEKNQQTITIIYATQKQYGQH